MAEEKDLEISPPNSFPFPFPPYHVQHDFMTSLFQTLESGGLGIFESPTGTGKSLSLICGTLTWYVAHEKERLRRLRQKVAEKPKNDQGDDGDDWITAQSQRLKADQARQLAKLELEALDEQQERMKELHRRRKSLRPSANDVHMREYDKEDKKNSLTSSLLPDGPVDENLLEDYESEGDDDDFDELADDEAKDYSLRIFYCSRTHSQISQFVQEVQKSPFADDVRLVSLASRNIMCVNDKVRALGSNSLVNETCLELKKKAKQSNKSNKSIDEKEGRKSKTGNSCSCPFYKQGNIGLLRDQSLLQVMDIEQMVSAGRKVGGCPYYASRQAIGDSQIITLPYNTLLHKPTRDAMGINLKNSVVIIDEAHNLLDTLIHLHSVVMSAENIRKAHVQLKEYFDKYRSRLKAKNLLYVKQIRFILGNFIKILDQNGKKSRMIGVEEFLMETGIDNLDKFKLLAYMNKSKIAQKLKGFQENLQKENGKVEKKKSKGLQAFLNKLEDKPEENTSKVDEQKKKPSLVSSPLLIVIEFIQALTYVHDAKILINIDEDCSSKSSIKYCLMNPSNQFGDLVKECRSIIVAGGTMQPISEFREQLFVNAGAQLERISVFSCGHVIPKENVLPILVTNGPTGTQFDFSYSKREDPKMFEELHRLLSNFDKLIPNGAVCFFPSYEFEKRFQTFLSNRTQPFKKSVFREPKKTEEVDKVLRDYSRAAKSSEGAFLFSVVGGKMSEGINFSDELGRAVIMVGLPFPNVKSMEMQEKMKYLNTNVEMRSGRTAGQIYYENLCMKAVNQSIGRAIRHRNDFAVMLLVDHRYQRSSITSQLPGWIQNRVMAAEKFPQVILGIRDFFKAFKEKQTSV